MITPEQKKKLVDLQTDHWNRLDAMVKSGVHFSTNENEKKSYTDLSDLLPNEGKILDIGSNLGEAYNYLKRFEYHGVECLEKYVKIATERGIPNCKVGFMEELPYEDDEFDYAWTRHVLEHSIDINIAFKEIKRVVKKDGLLAFIVPCGFHNEPAHLVERTKEGWKELITQGGFRIIMDGQHDFNLNEYYGVAINEK